MTISLKDRLFNLVPPAMVALVVLFWAYAPKAVTSIPWMLIVTSSLITLTVLLLEPFYVSAGFGMYLNRRTELEAWDIEQEFRRAFAS